jgi:hypothetical protein
MTTYRVLLPHPFEARLLMMQRDGEWRLPEWEDSTPHSWQATEHVNRAVSVRFGTETTVLRCVLNQRDVPTQRLRVYELDNHSAPHDVVPASTWIGRGEMDMLRISDADTRALLTDWFMREAGELALRGSPWTRRGWYVEALSWSVARLREHAASLQTAPEQVRAWERDFVMRLQADIGSFYFKAISGMSMHEPALSRWLAEQYAGSFPEVVAVDESRGWLLQRAVAAGALPLDEVREEEEWYRAARRLGEVQVETTRRLGELRQLDVPYRGLEVLARRVPELCADEAALRGGGPEALTAGELDRVAALGPTLLTLCEELASFQIPDALDHGDLRACNVLSTLGGPVYVEWMESSISHPFFSLGSLMPEAIGLLPSVSRESRRRMRDSYLAAWTGYAPADHLVRAFEIAQVLAPVQRAATTHAEVLPGAGFDWELTALVPECMREALRRLSGEYRVD